MITNLHSLENLVGRAPLIRSLILTINFHPQGLISVSLKLKLFNHIRPSKYYHFFFAWNNTMSQRKLVQFVRFQS